MFVRSPPASRTKISRQKWKCSYVGGTFDGLAKIRSASALRIFARASTPYEHSQHVGKCSHGGPYEHAQCPEKCSYGVAPGTECPHWTGNVRTVCMRCRVCTSLLWITPVRTFHFRDDHTAALACGMHREVKCSYGGDAPRDVRTGRIQREMFVRGRSTHGFQKCSYGVEYSTPYEHFPEGGPRTNISAECSYGGDGTLKMFVRG